MRVTSLVSPADGKRALTHFHKLYYIHMSFRSYEAINMRFIIYIFNRMWAKQS
jgi:hypothetical protein